MKIINLLKNAVKYSAYLIAGIKVIQFAIETFEALQNPESNDKQ